MSTWRSTTSTTRRTTTRARKARNRPRKRPVRVPRPERSGRPWKGTMDWYRNGTGRKVRGTQSVSDTCDRKTGLIFFFIIAFVACLGCQRRKTKCERQAGDRVACLRCHQMKVRCSFLDGDRKHFNRRLDKGTTTPANRAVWASGSGEPTSPISAYLHGDPVDALTMRLNDMERRLAGLELERIQGELLRIKTEPESGPVFVPPLVYREDVAGPSGTIEGVGMEDEVVVTRGPVVEPEPIVVPVVVPEPVVESEPVGGEERPVSGEEPANVPETNAQEPPAETGKEKTPEPAPVVKEEPAEPRVPSVRAIPPPVRRVQGSFQNREVEILEILSDDE